MPAGGQPTSLERRELVGTGERENACLDSHGRRRVHTPEGRTAIGRPTAPDRPPRRPSSSWLRTPGRRINRNAYPPQLPIPRTYRGSSGTYVRHEHRVGGGCRRWPGLARPRGAFTRARPMLRRLSDRSGRDRSSHTVSHHRRDLIATAARRGYGTARDTAVIWSDGSRRELPGRADGRRLILD